MSRETLVRTWFARHQLPHICIIDPRTGRRVKAPWACATACCSNSVNRPLVCHIVVHGLVSSSSSSSNTAQDCPLVFSLPFPAHTILFLAMFSSQILASILSIDQALNDASVSAI